LSSIFSTLSPSRMSDDHAPSVATSKAFFLLLLLSSVSELSLPHRHAPTQSYISGGHAASVRTSKMYVFTSCNAFLGLFSPL
jgi:hypothetical protein